MRLRFFFFWLGRLHGETLVELRPMTQKCPKGGGADLTNTHRTRNERLTERQQIMIPMGKTSGRRDMKTAEQVLKVLIIQRRRAIQLGQLGRHSNGPDKSATADHTHTSMSSSAKRSCKPYKECVPSPTSRTNCSERHFEHMHTLGKRK